MLSEALAEEWNDVQKQSLLLMSQNMFEASLEALELFSARHEQPEIRGEVLGFMAIVKETMGDPEAAILDLQDAHDLATPDTYRRYGIELALGRLCQGAGNLKGAADWYLRAVETATLDPLTSGASAVEAFLRVKDVTSWDARDEELCYAAVRQAWRLFALAGEPALEDLRATLKTLSDASSRPLPRVGGEA